MVQFREKTPKELSAWLPGMWEHYVNERLGAGEDADAVRQSVAAQQGQLFPGGHVAEGQHIMDIVVADAVVGTIWLGRPLSGAGDTWFVFDIEIDKPLRGRGHGRAAMEQAEGWAREHGATKLGLNVFGPNHVARALYDSLGYQVMATAMVKEVGPRPS